jgi:putative protease
MLKKIELLSPAGSMEALKAAVSNGADAVYLGAGNFNARHFAENFGEEELAEAGRLCRLHGVRLYLTLNTLVSDRETGEYLKTVARANEIGVDAVLVQDLGMVGVIRRAAPDLPVHGSTQMSVHNLDGVLEAAKMGIARVVLARELPREEIRAICEASPIETEVFVHGSLCMSYSGQCYMSAVIGERSGNRGRCAQPCRMPGGMGGGRDDYPLSLKDLCLAPFVEELRGMGVAALKIEGRMKRPEYVAVVTGIYSRLIRTGLPPSGRDLLKLRQIFSRDGFTDGYFEDRKGPPMFGVRDEKEENDPAYRELLRAAAQTYAGAKVPQPVPVDFEFEAGDGTPARLEVRDRDKNAAVCLGAAPEKALHRELDFITVKEQLEKTGGTPFFPRSVSSVIRPGCMLPLSEINRPGQRRTHGIGLKPDGAVASRYPKVSEER